MKNQKENTGFPFPRNPVIEAYKKDLDPTLIRASLSLTPEERVLRLVALQKTAIELKKAGKEQRKHHDGF